MNIDDVKKMIEDGLPGGATVELSGEGCNLSATVISEAFEGLSMLKQHQLVYGIVNPHIADGSIHALALKTYTPAQWEARGQA
ncbi:MAG TPA: BolA/IbaG family iron-sulfur metabolism protein [Thioalkalivibrio sp.]|nr:BolA/IbaG family iron-sulfur metabolism protein [Thioalkalivibrio sp.]